MDESTGGHYLDVGEGPIRLDPPVIRMQSTEVPWTETRTDGTVVEGTIRVMHAEGVPVPTRLNTRELPAADKMLHCPWHGGTMLPEHAVAAGTAADNPAHILYACLACAHFYGITPLADHPDGSTGQPISRTPRFIGRRDGLPIAPVRRA